MSSRWARTFSEHLGTLLHDWLAAAAQHKWLSSAAEVRSAQLRSASHFFSPKGPFWGALQS